VGYSTPTDVKPCGRNFTDVPATKSQPWPAVTPTIPGSGVVANADVPAFAYVSGTVIVRMPNIMASQSKVVLLASLIVHWLVILLLLSV
jgi:hypothetical protein